MDTAFDEEQVGEAKRVIMDIDGVRSVHMLRTRRHGAEASADVHIQVAPRLSVSEGHMISQAVEDRMIGKLEAITDVTVHIDPEDDEDCADLPRPAVARRGPAGTGIGLGQAAARSRPSMKPGCTTWRERSRWSWSCRWNSYVDADSSRALQTRLDGRCGGSTLAGPAAGPVRLGSMHQGGAGSGAPHTLGRCVAVVR